MVINDKNLTIINKPFIIKWLIVAHKNSKYKTQNKFFIKFHICRQKMFSSGVTFYAFLSSNTIISEFFRLSPPT